MFFSTKIQCNTIIILFSRKNNSNKITYNTNTIKKYIGILNTNTKQTTDNVYKEKNISTKISNTTLYINK